jgi:hypothetical protein
MQPGQVGGSFRHDDCGQLGQHLALPALLELAVELVAVAVVLMVCLIHP